MKRQSQSGSQSLFPQPGGASGDLPGAPLADRMRPRSLEELVGQQHLLEPGSVLRGMIEEGAGRLRSILLFGPPGTGKTSLARMLALRSDAEFIQLSAVSSGVADVRKALEEGRTRRQVSGRPTILFVDEVHRFSKTQQDALLP
ncbi:MAG: AAA family ATPase, partial [Actinomycetota bacterium]